MPGIAYAVQVRPERGLGGLRFGRFDAPCRAVAPVLVEDQPVSLVAGPEADPRIKGSGEENPGLILRIDRSAPLAGPSVEFGERPLFDLR